MDRPRRSTRQPVKAPQLVRAEPPPRVIKRKPAEVDPEKILKTLLESSKSDLVSLDMNDIINYNTWTVLSEDSKARLKSLLPPTAFTNYHETLGSDHPSLENAMLLDEPEKEEEKGKSNIQDMELTSPFFTDPHFLAAARTFQDHLYSNWFSEAHIQKVRQYQEGIANGTLASPWKDETWERDNPVPEPPPKDIGPSSSFSTPNALAGGASQIKLYILAKNNIIRVGDIIAFRRVFTTSVTVIEKDAIVQSIHPKTFAITLLAPRGTTKDLPQNLLSNEPLSDTSDSPELILSMTITSLSMLETAILDTDGRVDRSRRPNGNAWKTFSVWRFRAGGEYNPYDSRGGRENHGTLFYLRGSFYHESWRN